MATQQDDAQKSEKDRLIDQKMRALPTNKDPKGGKKTTTDGEKKGGDKSCGGEKGCGGKSRVAGPVSD